MLCFWLLITHEIGVSECLFHLVFGRLSLPSVGFISLESKILHQLSERRHVIPANSDRVDHVPLVEQLESRLTIYVIMLVNYDSHLPDRYVVSLGYLTLSSSKNFLSYNMHQQIKGYWYLRLSVK